MNKLEQLKKLAQELINERAQQGIDAFKEDGNFERASLFFEDASKAKGTFKEFLECLGEEPE